MKKRIIMFLTSLVFFTALTFSGGTVINDKAYAAQTYTLSYPTREQIKARYKQYAIDLKKSPVYTKNYSLTAPYAMGDVSEYDRQNALNTLNFCRYIAGLPDDIELNDEYNDLAQAASLVNAANDGLSHSPLKPAGMSDELYEKGAQGAGSSNIGMGYRNLADSIVRGYMEDTDPGNIDRVGHRRWLLNPSLKYIGFGQVGGYSAAYVFGKKRTEAFDGDYVAWPPPNMPMELYSTYNNNYAFSVTLGDDYDFPKLSQVTVEVYSEKQNKTWKLDKSCSDVSDISKFLTVNNDNYGNPKCIIFNVGAFTAGDTVSVKINGISKNGVSSPISYKVNFFEIEHKHSYTAEVTKSPTCESTGIRTYTCKNCGDSYTESIPKRPHDYSPAWTTDKTPTCTAEGSKSHHCTVCGAKSSITPIAKTAHTYSSKITKAATCTEAGIKTVTCTACSETHTENIPAAGHSFGGYVIKQAATVDKAGIEERTCSECGITEQRAIPKLPEESSPETSSDESSSTSGESSDAGESSGAGSETEVSSTGESSGASSETEASSTGESSDIEASSEASSEAEKADDTSGSNDDTSKTGSSVGQPDGKSNFTAIIIIGCSVAAVGIAAAVIISKKRKK